MTINLHFSHVEVPDYLRFNIEGYITEMFGELAQKNNLFVNLFCKKEVTSKNSDEKFKCHIEAHAPWLHKKIFVQASGDECWETIMSASARMKRQIFSHKKSDHRKRGRTDWNLAAYAGQEIAI
jgi:ribosome-associated translation inhibitor RaiA